jgi:phenylacetyl-CoA:acceptor oxidoreductase subunit 1
MTRYVMVADLRRCVGCQTCAAACKHANATPPGVQWRQVLDMETGTYPQVQRTFVPVGCMHCADPPCESVCPSTATKIRPDGNQAMANEEQRHDEGRMSVAMKCNFCQDRIDLAAETGQTPGIDPEVTPACVNSCIADALHFGDKDDPDSNVNKLLAENQTFRMHEELGTDPGFYYIWDKK